MHERYLDVISFSLHSFLSVAFFRFPFFHALLAVRVNAWMVAAARVAWHNEDVTISGIL